MKVLVKAPDYAEVLKWLDPVQRAVIEVRMRNAILLGVGLGGLMGIVSIVLVNFIGQIGG